MSGKLSEKIARKIIPEPMSGCWIWIGSLSTAGYGSSWRNGRAQAAHRLVYEDLVGPIPADKFMDHLCRVRCCVNPDHLEPVTNKENILRGSGFAARNARKSECVNGHRFTSRNTYMRPNGRRACRACKRSWMRTTYRRRNPSGQAEIVRTAGGEE